MRLYLVYLFSILFLATMGQGFRVRHLLPGASANLSKTIFETSPGNYIAGGIIVDSLTGGNRLCIMGLGSQGQKLWTKRYGSNKFMYLDNPFISRCFYKQGNSLFYTTSVLDSNGKYIGVLMKFNLNGDTIWQKIYRDSDPLEDVVPQMLTSSYDGGLLITGYFQNNSNMPYSKCMLIKTDINGKELWRKKIGKTIPDVEDGRNIIQDSASKKIVITGYQYIGNAASSASYDNVVILDSLGNLLTRKNYMTAPGGVLLDMIQTRDKKIVMVGYVNVASTPDFNNLIRAFAVKFDLNAPSSAIWRVVLDLPSPANGFTCLSELGNGDLMVAGTYDTQQLNNLPENDLVRLVRIAPNGVVRSKKYYDYKINDSSSANSIGVKSINLNADGSLVAAISVASISYPRFTEPFFFVKWDSTGCDSSLTYCVMMNNVGIHENKLYNKAQINVCPNPTIGFINISMPGTNAGEELQLTITDVTAREIKKLSFEPDGNNYKLNLSDLSNGVYIIRLSRNKELLYLNKLVKQEE